MEPKESGRQGRPRRGVYGDAGGAIARGVPDAPAVAVGCEAMLRAELERMPTLLVPVVDWSQRVEALLRLEGLARGGAAKFAVFPDLLHGMRDALAGQMQDRRSAVSRQACHAVGVLAGACGHGFEPLAVHLLPVVFKTLAMGITVVSEAADACTHAMLGACPSARLLPKLCTVLTGDRDGRLRQSAAEFLLCALEGWEPAIYERQLEAVERAVLAAAQDAQAETRAVGRSLFAAYARAWPAQAQAVLGRLNPERERQLQEKLLAAAQEYLPGLFVDGSTLSQPVSRRSSMGNSGGGTPRGGPSRTSSLSSSTSGHLAAGAIRAAPVVPKLALAGLNSMAESARDSPPRPSSARFAAPSASASLAPGGTWQQQPATARENQPDNRAVAAAAVQATPRSMFPKALARREMAANVAEASEATAEQEPVRPASGGRERLAPRRSMGGAALRMSVASFRRQESSEALEEAASQPPAAAAHTMQRAVAPHRGAMRLPLPLPQTTEPHQNGDAPASRPLTARRVGGLERQASSITGESEASSGSNGLEESCSTAAPTASLAPLLAGLSKAGIGWGERVSAYRSVQATMEASGTSQAVAADVASNSDRLVAALLEGAADAHFKVAAAALGALGSGLAGPCSRLFEAQLDRVMTTLFARVADPKEHIRGLVAAALASALAQHSADAVLAALARSLQANRAPRVKCAVMEYFAAATRSGGGGGGGDDAVVEGRPGLLQQLVGSGSALGGLLRSLLQLATDKNPDIRRAAVEAVAAAHLGGAAQAVLVAVQNLPPAEHLAVQRAIGPLIPPQPQQNGKGGNGGSGGAEMQQQPGAPAATSRPGSRTGAGGSSQQHFVGNLSSRRHSIEGGKQASQQHPQPRLEKSGSLTARSRQGSQAGSPAPGKQQSAAPASAAALPAVAPAATVQRSPEPPSPFLWRVRSASPLDGTEATAPAQPLSHAPTEPALARAPAAAAKAAVQAGAAPQQTRQQAERPAAQAHLPPPVSELAPFDDVMAAQLQRLLVQLEGVPNSEALQGLCRLAHALPAAVWSSCFEQVIGAVCAALECGTSVLRDAGLMLTRDLAAAAQPSLFLPSLPLLLPRLLACAAEQEAPEVAVAADEALAALLSRLPPQTCLAVLAPLLPTGAYGMSADRQQGGELLAAIRSLRRVVCHMQPAGLNAHLQPLLVPGLCAAYRSPLTDVRKATVDCLVTIWLVVGAAIKPHLDALSGSQLKLLEIYYDRARRQTA